MPPSGIEGVSLVLIAQGPRGNRLPSASDRLVWTARMSGCSAFDTVGRGARRFLGRSSYYVFASFFWPYSISQRGHDLFSLCTADESRRTDFAARLAPHVSKAAFHATIIRQLWRMKTGSARARATTAQSAGSPAVQGS